jgi:hypothetical protein
MNPCPLKPIPGVNSYFPHLFPNRYIHCDFDGRAFVRNCAPGLKWRQAVLSCLPDDFTFNVTEAETTTMAPRQQQRDRQQTSYGQKTQVRQQVIPVPVPVQPVQTSYQQARPVVPVQQVRQQALPVAVKPVQSSYGQQQQTRPVVPVQQVRQQVLPVAVKPVQTSYDLQPTRPVAPVVQRDQRLPQQQPAYAESDETDGEFEEPEYETQVETVVQPTIVQQQRNLVQPAGRVGQRSMNQVSNRNFGF